MGPAAVNKSYASAVADQPTGGQRAIADHSTGGQRQQQQQEMASKSRVRLVGRSANSDMPSSFKAARPIVRKAVYGLYNCDLNETAQSLGQFVENVLQVGVISCFETNLNQPQRRTRSFRLCVNARDNASLLNPDHWDDSIVIKAWRFATNTNGGPRPAARGTAGDAAGDTTQESSAEGELHTVTRSAEPSCSGVQSTAGGGADDRQAVDAGVKSVEGSGLSEGVEGESVMDQQGASPQTIVS